MSIARRILQRFSGVPPVRDFLLRRHASLARRAGLDRLYLILSFDCDTDRDVEVVEELERTLRDKGIRASFAVPGHQLIRGSATYRSLSQAGYEFIGHGHREHCVLKDGHYVSTFFYDRATPEEVAEDIRLARATLRDVLGHPPLGYRVPHFGTYQRRGQLAFLHRTLAAEGYRFSSSTLPEYGLQRGVAPEVVPGLREIAVSGYFARPLAVLDSYGFRYGSKRLRPEAYGEQFIGLVRYFTQRALPGLINTYADPSQVHGFAPFHEAIAYVAARNVPSLQYSELLRLIR